jgi:hypothetical protein
MRGSKKDYSMTLWARTITDDATVTPKGNWRPICDESTPVRERVGVQYDLRTARRVWRMVVLATQTPLTRVLPAPQAATTFVIMPSG